MRSDAHRGLTCGKIGETPVVEDSGSRFSLQVISAISPRGDMRFSFIDEQDRDMLLTFLPAYSPELNPDEQVWNHAKAHLGKRSIFNKQDMKRHLVSILRSIQNRTPLIKSFFRMPGTAYILDAVR